MESEYNLLRNIHSVSRYQEASEKLGAAERTEYPADFEDLLRRADTVVDVTERILNASEALLQPNPGNSTPFTVHWQYLSPAGSMSNIVATLTRMQHSDSRASSTIWWSRRGARTRLPPKTLQPHSGKQYTKLEKKVLLVCFKFNIIQHIAILNQFLQSLG